MDSPVEPVAGRRERKALATRHRVLDAAEALFIRDGYAATTMTAIADAAHVAVQTPYAIFGTKRAILTELVAARVVGDDERAPLVNRAEFRAIEGDPDPRRQLAHLASLAAQIGNRIAALYQVMAAAAGSDPDIAEVYERQQEARYKDQRRIALSLSRTSALRSGLSVARATDIIWTLANPNTHHALVNERGWTTEEYEAWLGRLLACAILDEP